jgi:ParB-like nuclease domain
MKRKMKGVGLGARTDGEGKLGQLWKKKINTAKLRGGLKRSTANQTDERSPVKRRPSYDVLNVEIADIKITGRRRALNPAKIDELAESISSLGLQSPITARWVKRDLGWGKTKTELVLVSGLHRLEAVKQLGKTTTPCVILKGGKRIARMWEISENLHRAELTPFEHDEQVAEWVRLTQAEQAISGQNVQKKGRGRRKGGISEAAR